MNAHRQALEEAVVAHRQALAGLAAATDPVPWGPASTPLTEAVARVRETGQRLMREVGR